VRVPPVRAAVPTQKARQVPEDWAQDLPEPLERRAERVPLEGLVPLVAQGQRGLLPGRRVPLEPVCEFQQGAVASLLKALGYLEPQHAPEDWEQIQPALDRS
jgi:hypothetical protein